MPLCISVPSACTHSATHSALIRKERLYRSSEYIGAMRTNILLLATVLFAFAALGLFAGHADATSVALQGGLQLGDSDLEFQDEFEDDEDTGDDEFEDDEDFGDGEFEDDEDVSFETDDEYEDDEDFGESPINDEDDVS